MRESSARWTELRYERAVDADGHTQDVNVVQRAKVLWALQYDHRPEDLPLVRWLAEQEARWRREATFQGLGEEAELAGFLLAQYRQLPDVWLHWQIKRANFDTWCAYDIEYVVAAGAQATVDFVRDSEHTDRNDVLKRLAEVSLSEDDLEDWAQAGRERFPADPTDEDPLTWIERAKLAGEVEWARRELDRWAAGRERNAETLGILRYELADLGDFAEAAQAQRESLAFDDSAPAWRTLAELERRAGNYLAAWAAMQERGPSPDRRYVEELFLLAGAATGELAANAFAEADRQAREVPGLPLVVLRAAVEAADNVGDPDAATRYRALSEAERRRIERKP